MPTITFRDGNQIYTADLKDYKISYNGFVTPFGIRIYTSFAEAGATNLQMYLTGVILGLIILICQCAIGYWQQFSEIIIDPALNSLMLMTLLIFIFRLTPTASIHASEHQVILAMENENELNHDSVKTQDRVSTRCGTNLMVLFLMLNLFANLSRYISLSGLAQVLFIIVTCVLSLLTYTSIGGFIQRYFTTKPARPKDIDRAIEIGIEHNTKFCEYMLQNNTPSKLKMCFMHIKHSGMLPMLCGGFSIMLIVSSFFTIPGY